MASSALESLSEMGATDTEQLFQLRKAFKIGLAMLHGHALDLKRQYAALSKQLAAQEQLLHHVRSVKHRMDTINAKYGFTEEGQPSPKLVTTVFQLLTDCFQTTRTIQE